jgi:hypothetical protein
MPLIDKIREKKLIELAKTRFDPNLTPAERKVLHDSASSEDLPEPDEKATQPEVSAAFLRWLATDPEAAFHIDPKGLRVCAATVPGKLDLRECHANPTLTFYRCDFQGEINLESAETRGIYILDSSLAGGICAVEVIVHGSLFLQRIHSEGEIRLLGARIEGVLHCSGAKLKATGNALSTDGAKIDGGVFLNNGFDSEGAISLLGAEITGNLECDGAKLKDKVVALILDGAQIGGSVFLKDGFESQGEIRLLGAKIAGQLVCTGAKLKAQGNALILENAKIGSDVFLTDGFESEGAIRLHGAEIGGDLLIRCAKVAGVRCQNTVVKGDLAWQRIEKSNDIYLNLIGARVKNLRDEQASWPNEGNLDLDGLVYEELTLHEDDFGTNQYTDGLPFNVEERIKWLMLQPEKRRTEPQPWMQLRDLLERKGDRKGAKYVLFRFRCEQAKQRRFTPLLWLIDLSFFWRRIIKCIFGSPIVTARRIWSYLRHLNRSWSIAFAWLEENPLRIGYSILFTLALGALVFAGAVRSGAMIETVQTQPAMIATYAESAKGAARKPGESNKPVSIHYTSFQPFIYTLENAVPLVKLGMDERWMPDAQHQPQPWCRIGWLDWLKWFNSYGFLVWFRWLLIVWGWAQATILAASVADRFRK